MADKVYKQVINNWSEGINTLNDPFYLQPNSEKQNTAELVECDNFDINAEGALITSLGYEQVSTKSGLTGGCKALLNYEKDDTTRQLLITHDDDIYYITPSSTTWEDVGDYGTAGNVGGTVFKGTDSTRFAILGSDVSANDISKWDGTTLTALNDPPDYGDIMETFMGRLFIASGPTLYYSDVEEEDDFAGGGTIKFNDIITGLKVDGKHLNVITKSYHQGVTFTFDDENLISVPNKAVYEREFGGLAPGGVQKIHSNILYLADEGVFRLGAEENYDDPVPRPQSLSLKIDNDLRHIRKKYRRKIANEYFNQKYYLAVPYDSNINDKTYVYNTTWNCWTTRSGFYPADFAVFRNSDYQRELYFVDANNPILYKFNDKYDYAGSGYNRKIKSKKHIQGNANVMKRWYNFTITGEIYSATTFTVRLTVDNNSITFTVNNSHIIKGVYSEYLGQVYTGAGYVGGSDISDTSFLRFRRTYKIPQQIKEGYSLQYEIYNNEPGEPIKIDYIDFEYSYLPKIKVQDKFTK